MTNQDFNTETTIPFKVAERETHKSIHKMGDWVESPAGKSATYAAMVGAGLGLALVGLGYGLLWIFVFSFALAFGGVGGFWMLERRLQEMGIVVDRHVEKTAVPPAPPKGPPQFSVWFDLENGRPGVKIQDPRPGAFRAWLKSVINGRQQFSRNQAKERGFSETYDELINQLKSVGLLHETQLDNNAPAVTDWGRELAKGWLEK